MRTTIAVICIVACASTARGEKGPIRLAVMDFTAASTASEFEPLGVGLQSMITTDLGELPTAFVLVERARLKDIQGELSLQQTASVDKATAAKIGALAGASHLLVGSFTVVGGRMRIDARLFAVESGQVLLGEKIEGAQTAFFELEKSLVKKIVDAVGVRLGRKEKAELQKPETTNFDAFQKFSQGLVFFDEKKMDQAVASMQAAHNADPSFALATTKLEEFQWALSNLPKPDAPKPPEKQECRPNPMWSGPCTPSPPAPEVPTAPVVLASDGKRQVGMIVRASGQEASCLTPCQLHLPEGPVEVEVVTPVQYKKTINVPGGPTSLVVSTRNKTNLILGSVLAVLTVGATAATIGLAEAPISTSTTGPQAQEFWPFTFAIATGLAFPAIFYLLQMGKNDVRAESLATPRNP